MEDCTITNIAELKEALSVQRMLFKKDTIDEDRLVCWIPKEDVLYMFKMDQEIFDVLKQNNNADLRLVFSERVGHTRNGDPMQGVELLWAEQLSEEQEYRYSLSSSSHPNSEDTFSDYGPQPFEWGGLEGEEAELARWNCD